MKKQKKFYTEINNFINEEKFKRLFYNGEKTNYIISSFGKVINEKNNFHVLTPSLNKDGHYYVKLSINGKRKNLSVHRAVALYFIPNPDNKPIVHHFDKNPLNNHVENLIWCTQREHKEFHNNELYNERFKNKIRYCDDCNLSVYTNKQIHDVCKELERNTHSIKEISYITGVKKDTIYNIFYKKQWVKISDKYKIDNFNKMRKSRIKRKGSTTKEN